MGVKVVAEVGVKVVADIRNAFSFFTILPISGKGSLEDVTKAGYLLPLVALALGAVEGLLAWTFSFIFTAPVSAALVLGAALILSGFHHADGLADLGDAIMVRGGRVRRIEVLKDKTMGIGAVGAVFLTYLISWAALAQFLAGREGVKLLLGLILIEVTARLGLIIVAILSKPSHTGSGSFFLKAMKGRRGAAGLLLSAVFLAVPIALLLSQSLYAIGAGIALAVMITLLSRHWFGGAGGDVLGATVELGRMAALLGLVAFLAS